MKSVALVGFSKRSDKRAWSLPEGCELWACNHGHIRGYPRLDALFDMHPWDLIQEKNFYTREYQQSHRAFLTAEHDFPIWMVKHYDEIPASREYPLNEALLLAGGMLFFTSSFCYMIASAIMQGYERILVLGFDMDTGTEYEYQREEAWKWIAFARGMGLTVEIAPESGLWKKVMLYGYEGIPMVSRQTIEAHSKSYGKEYDKAVAQKNFWLGVLAQREKSKPVDRRLVNEAREKVLGYERQAAMNEGAAQALAYLLETCDLKEILPVLTDTQAERSVSHA